MAIDDPENGSQRDNEIALMKAVARGDEEAIKQLWETYWSVVSRFVRHVMPDITQSDSEDVVQETFIGALRSANDYRGDSSVTTWICRIAKYKAIDHLRRRKGIEKHEEPIESMSSDEVSFPSESSNEVEENIEDEQDIALVRKAMALLPDDQREALARRYFVGMRVDDVAETMKVSRRKAELLITKGRAALIKILNNLDKPQ